jgi:ataxia telangiectasia mutated family protein
MVLDHPFHSLHQVFALAHGDQVSRVSMSVAGGAEMNEARIRAAAGLLNELKKLPSVKDLVIAQERMFQAYIALGSQKYQRGIDHIPLASTPLASLRQRELALVPVPTLTIPVRADFNYKTSAGEGVGGRSDSGGGGSASATSGSLESGVVTIARFDPRIHMATSGVNVPLILEMLCSDGKRHKQLLKSADDLRQDCVMEQVFGLVNELLQVNRQTAARQLHIRTYNVVPLTPGVGLVEWVTNTTSLAECLVTDRLGAHVRHPRPGQKRDYRQSLHYLREAHEARNPEEYAARFKSVCEDFTPVFHRWFLEMFPSPSEWLARRTAYTRSAAVTSIVGFVVGLGDRHIHNILLDTHTCELVHIDLGVAFDMGIVLSQFKHKQRSHVQCDRSQLLV